MALLYGLTSDGGLVVWIFVLPPGISTDARTNAGFGLLASPSPQAPVSCRSLAEGRFIAVLRRTGLWISRHPPHRVLLGRMELAPAVHAVFWPPILQSHHHLVIALAIPTVASAAVSLVGATAPVQHGWSLAQVSHVAGDESFF